MANVVIKDVKVMAVSPVVLCSGQCVLCMMSTQEWNTIEMYKAGLHDEIGIRFKQHQYHVQYQS